jgi:hypothetical protein
MSKARANDQATNASPTVCISKPFTRDIFFDSTFHEQYFFSLFTPACLHPIPIWRHRKHQTNAPSALSTFRRTIASNAACEKMHCTAVKSARSLSCTFIGQHQRNKPLTVSQNQLQS